MSDENAMAKPNKSNKPETTNKKLSKQIADENARIDNEVEQSKKKLEDAVNKKAKRVADELMAVMNSTSQKILENMGYVMNSEENPEFFRDTLDEIINSIK